MNSFYDTKSVAGAIELEDAAADIDVEQLMRTDSRMVRAVRFEMGSEQFIVYSVPSSLDKLRPLLSRTEFVVCEELLLGSSNAQIAKNLEKSLRTVANQVANIFKKLGVSSRAELVTKVDSLTKMHITNTYLDPMSHR